MYSIPFNHASFEGKEQDYIAQAIASGHISGDGLFSQKCHKWLEQETGVAKVLLTSSCTHALDMCALLLNIQPNDEVVLPSFTFTSTATAFALRGAKIVFADIRHDTLNIDETQIETRITPNTKAIVVMHYGGVGCEMESIAQIANRRNLSVIEDNAHGLFGMYRGKQLGTFGCLAAQSFHETKNFTCGEGGALLINDRSLVERAEIIREKGTNRSRFFRGQVDKYTWVDIGSSYLLSEILAAFLWAQFEKREQIQSKRQYIWQRYKQSLGAWALANGVALPFVPPHCEHPAHLFYLIMPSLKIRQSFIEYMKARGILCVFHYLPLHLSPMGIKFEAKPGDCPIAENISDRLVRLPLFNSLTTRDQDKVISAILEFTP